MTGMGGQNDQYYTPNFDEVYYRQSMDRPMPCVKGSDSHKIDYPFGRLLNQNSEPIERFCWIKGDITFNGLRQITFEPDRVFIGKEPEIDTRIKSTPHKFISTIEVTKEDTSRLNEVWFDNTTIGINPGLVCIIGKKGNGKSAVADIIGLCAGSKNSTEDLSFLTKAKFKNPKSNKAKEFKAKLSWADGSDSGYINLNSEVNSQQEERVKYIPQNYLEKLCVNEEQKEFEDELKKIIFAHIPISERLGQNNLQELILVRQKSFEEVIGHLRLEIASVNKEIARRELKSKISYLKDIEQQIFNKQTDLKYHDENKPLEKAKPDEDEEQRKANQEVLKEIEQRKQIIARLYLDKAQYEKELGVNNISINDLNGVLAELDQLNNNLSKFVAQSQSKLSPHDIDLTKVITYKIDKTLIEKKVEVLKERNAILLLLINGDDNTDGITSKVNSEGRRIEELNEKLASAQKEFQDYLQNLQSWTRRRDEIIGTKEVQNSLEYLKAELAHIGEPLQKELKELEQKRLALSVQIFESKVKILEVYSALYKPITEVLQKESSFVEEYNIRVNASLIFRTFTDRFLSFVNQKSKGSFSGSVEGREMLEHFIERHSLGNIEESTSFLNDIMLHLKTDMREAANQDIRYTDDQLKKDGKIEDLYDFIFGLEYVEPQFKLQLGPKDLKELSPGERGAILLIFYLFLDLDNKTLIIDQPEENLDNESIYYYLVHFIKKAKDKRQIILITHNPNLAVVCDADQIIHLTIDKKGLNKVAFYSGGIENPKIAGTVINILEGTKPAFDNRRLKYSRIE